jgi:hypothetical protein
MRPDVTYSLSISLFSFDVCEECRFGSTPSGTRLSGKTRRHNDAIHDASQVGRKLGSSSQELMDAMAKLSEEAAKANTMIDSGGLAPTAMSQRVRLSRGNLTVLDGPFTEAKEVVGGYAQFEFKSREEATEAAVRFMELHQRH